MRAREHRGDPYVKRSRADGYRSRAAYKLLEIDHRDRLLRRGSTVVDLGAAPGSWSQVCAERVSAAGRVVALDLLPMAPIPGVTFIEGDFREGSVYDELTAMLGDTRVQLVLSDMAPNISGVRTADQARSLHLAELALQLSDSVLEPDGNLLVKVFQGAGYDEFLREMKARFLRVAVRKPEASRPRSRELYLLGQGHGQD